VCKVNCSVRYRFKSTLVSQVGILKNFGKVEILSPPNLVLARSEDGHVVVHDGVLVAGGLQPQHNPLLLLTGKLCFVDVVPAVRLVILRQGSALVLAQLFHWPTFHEHAVQGNRLLLGTIKHIGCFVIENDRLSVNVSAVR